MPDQTPPIRPNLEKESVAMSTVKGVGLGALTGTGAALILKAASRESAGLGAVVASWGAVGGLVGFMGARNRNQVKSEARPYVERLEQELISRTLAGDKSAER